MGYGLWCVYYIRITQSMEDIPMKCVVIHNENDVYRMKDAKAKQLVDKGEATYVDKKIWKDTGRKYK